MQEPEADLRRRRAMEALRMFEFEAGVDYGLPPIEQHPMETAEEVKRPPSAFFTAGAPGEAAPGGEARTVKITFDSLRCRLHLLVAPPPSSLCLTAHFVRHVHLVYTEACPSVLRLVFSSRRGSRERCRRMKSLLVGRG